MAKTSENPKVNTSDYYNELVEVTLFKDSDKYKDDVFVSVNGVGMIVPRGKKVKIPRKYALCLENSKVQDSYAQMHIENLSKKADSVELN